MLRVKEETRKHLIGFGDKGVMSNSHDSESALGTCQGICRLER